MKLTNKDKTAMKNGGHLYPINTEVYYTGDMANHSGRGFVKSFRENSMGRSMDIVIEGEWDTFTESYAEDREFRGLTMAHFSCWPWAPLLDVEGMVSRSSRQAGSPAEPCQPAEGNGHAGSHAES